ncbi:MAG: tRNA-intron lyase, partial [Candidatus Nitrosomaritimum yanchengensis]
MDETPLVEGELISDQTKISNKDMIHELELKGYGETEDGKLFLKFFESLYLLYSDKLILKKGKKAI